MLHLLIGYIYTDISENINEMKRIGVLFILTWVLFGCSAEKKHKHSDKFIFTYNEPAGITSLDPAFCSSLENIRAVNQLFNGLVQMNDELKVQPCIAKSWELSEDGRVYTFHLRDDVYFHDHEMFPNGKGRKVVAQDFFYSFFRIIDPKTASTGAQWIVKLLDDSDEADGIGFKAENDSTFKVYLKAPFLPFLGMLTMQYFSVVPNEVIEHYGSDFRRNPIGTGPFIFKEWVEGGKLIMLKNSNYFEVDSTGYRLPYADAVNVLFIKDEEIAFHEFLKGGLDMLNGLNGEYRNQILDKQGNLLPEYEDKISLLSIPFLNTEYLGFMVDPEMEEFKNSPIQNKKIRQAINYGFDRVSMVKYMRNSMGTPALSGFVPKGMPSYDEEKVKGYNYDPEKAKQLLAEAGFPNGKGLPVIKLSTTGQYLDLCEFIQSQLNDVGIRIQLDVNPPGVHKELVAKSQVEFFRKSWIADYPSAENYLSLFNSKNFSPKGSNYTHFKSYKYDVMLETAIKEQHDSTRYEMYKELDKILIEEAPIVPLYYDQVVRFTKKNVTNLGVNPTNLLTLKYVRRDTTVEVQ